MAPREDSRYRLDAGDREKMTAEVRELTWRWARRLMGRGPNDAPVSEDENLPTEQVRAAQLALLAACEQLRTELDERARQTAAAAAAAGVDYPAMGAAVGMTRQGARRRWPGLAGARTSTTEQPPV